jgi:V/A-type H+/Na+-transporting ATPase subunit K
MISKRLSRYLFFGSFVAVMMAPAVAHAAEGAAATGGLTVGDGLKSIGAALAMGMAALGAGWAQAKIGSAGQGVLAERPEERIWVITLTALPEIIVLLGFVMAIILKG